MENKNKFYSIALASAFLVIAFLILISVASSSQVTKIGNGTDPAVYGSNVVWTDEGVIHVYNLTAKTDTTINSSEASHPAIYGNKLVWHDESIGTPRLAVYDIKTAARSYITEDIDRSSIPYIYGNRIVWSANYNETNHNYNVYMRDISTSMQTKIADGNKPDIYNTKIAYGYEDRDGRTIAVYDIDTKETINASSSSQIFSPHIYGNKVIWSNFYTRDGFIQMYDLVTKKTIDVTSDNTGNILDPDIADAGDDTGTHIDINGDKIIYSKSGDDQFGYAGVYVYGIPLSTSTPVHIYPKGTYTTPDIYNDTIVWGIDSSRGVNTVNDSGIYVTSLSTAETLPPVAEFTANVTSGVRPLVVLFTDTVTGGSPASWLWDFGDGTNSKHSMYATHTFTNPGGYTISLTVENSAGNSTAIKKNYIVVTDPGTPIANFSTNVTGGLVPLTVQFIDLSQNATSISWDTNGDGIEDSNASSFAYEYTSKGIYTAKLTAINANGTDEKTAIIDVYRKSPIPPNAVSNRGGGGSPEPAKNVQVKELSQVFITNGKAVQFDFTKNATCVVYVGFDAKKTVGKTTTIVEQLKNKSTLTSSLTDGKVYKYFNVWVGNSGFASSENIENSTICFKVEKFWMQDKNIDRKSITLNRYSNKTWEQIPVSLLKEDNKYLYFTADVSGFSFFAITGKEIAKETMTDIQSEPKLQDPEEKTGNTTGNTAGVKQEPEQEQNKSTPGFVTIYGVISLLVFYLHKRK